MAPRTNNTVYYSRDAVDNGLGEVHLPVVPAMSLFGDPNIGYIAKNGTIRLTAPNGSQEYTITAEALGDGISSANMNWTRTGLALGPAAHNNDSEYKFTINSSTPSGSLTIKATSVHDPGLFMTFTIRVIDLIVMNTENDVEMTPNYTLYVDSSPSAPTVLNFTASKAVDWRIVSQTGVRAALSSTNGTANILTIPTNYRGTINLRVTSGALIRNFRIVVRR